MEGWGGEGRRVVHVSDFLGAALKESFIHLLHTVQLQA